jgi:hypothetical protein
MRIKPAQYRIKILLITFAILLLSAFLQQNKTSFAFADKNKPSGKIIAYYFHGNFRCPTCTKMEKYSREAIDANFKNLIQSGNLEFKEINVDEKSNEHFVNEYKLYTKTLILSLVKDGKEIRSKNLEKIWEYAQNKNRFTEYINSEITNFIKESQ